jgi:hypothetical protein
VARTAHFRSSSGGTSHNSRPPCRNVDESQLRQIADGGNDIRPARSLPAPWYASPASHVGYELIGPDAHSRGRRTGPADGL